MDQLTVDDFRAFPASLIGPMTRMGEKVAAIEGRFGAEIAALKEDTTEIRQMMHGVTNAQQLSASAEKNCAMQLAIIGEKLAAHTEQVTQNVAFHRQALEDLKAHLNAISSKVETLTAARHWVIGGYWAAGKIVAIILGALALLWNTLQHLKLAP